MIATLSPAWIGARATDPTTQESGSKKAASSRGTVALIFSLCVVNFLTFYFVQIYALLEAAATISPSGMQNRFGNRVRASYIRAERGSQQPRSLSVAFLKPVAGKDMLTTAIDWLEKTAMNMDTAYGACADASQRLVADAEKSEGSLTALKAFVGEVYRG